jgi:hypothetical protein
MIDFEKETDINGKKAILYCRGNFFVDDFKNKCCSLFKMSAQIFNDENDIEGTILSEGSFGDRKLWESLEEEAIDYYWDFLADQVGEYDY